jgi:hypothetical protein
MDLNAQLFIPVSKEEVFQVLGLMGKDKSPSPNGWTIELFIYFLDLLGEDLLWVVKMCGLLVLFQVT